MLQEEFDRANHVGRVDPSLMPMSHETRVNSTLKRPHMHLVSLVTVPDTRL